MEQRFACAVSPLIISTSRSCRLYSWSTGKSILGVSVAVTSGSHLFVKDLAPFKLLFPFSRPILYTKLSCHWWHQMASIIVYSSRSKDGLQYMLLERTVLSHPPPPQHYEFMLHAIRMYCCLVTFIHTFYIQHTDLSNETVPVSVIFKQVDNVKCQIKRHKLKFWLIMWLFWWSKFPKILQFKSHTTSSQKRSLTQNCFSALYVP